MNIRYHTEHHLAQQVREARVWPTEQLAQKLQDLDSHAQEVLSEAKKAGDNRLRLNGIEVAGRNIERIARIAGTLDLEERLQALEAERSGQS